MSVGSDVFSLTIGVFIIIGSVTSFQAVLGNRSGNSFFSFFFFLILIIQIQIFI